MDKEKIISLGEKKIFLVLFSLAVVSFGLGVAAESTPWYQTSESGCTIYYYSGYFTYSSSCPITSIDTGFLITLFPTTFSVLSTSNSLDTAGSFFAGVNMAMILFLVLSVWTPEGTGFLTEDRKKIFSIICFVINGLSILFYFIGFITLLRITSAIKQDSSSISFGQGTCDIGPCTSFSGSQSGETWGPSYGWILAIIACGVGVACLAFHLFTFKLYKVRN
jgi:hypothetical protein